MKARPFLKWAGGKGQLLAQIVPMLPARFDRYFEPFVGGGALFFRLRPKRAMLSDVNAELVDCYSTLRDDVEAVIAALGRHRYQAEHYYRVRALMPSSLPRAERAARTIYLNRTGYNGLYRVNRAGRFNVPMGRYARPVWCNKANLRACSQALEGAVIRKRDFAEALEKVRAGDLVYLDPPYVPLSATSAFTSYAPGGFDEEDQRRLAALFGKLARRGAYVVLSNSDTPAVRELYAGYRIDGVLAARSINSRGERRGKIGEVVVRNFESPTDAPAAAVHQASR